MKKRSYLYLFIIFSLIGSPVFAEFERDSSVRVMGRFFPDKVHIGDEIALLVMIDAPDAYKIQKPEPASGQWGVFELRSEELLRESHDKKTKRLIYKYKLTIFDIGDFKIPPLLVKYSDASGVFDVAMLGAMPVKVTPLPEGPKEKDDIRPIKGPISLDLAIWRHIFLGSLTFLLFVWLCVRLYFHWHKKKMDDESLKPPHIRLELELGRLQERSLLGQGLVKEHFAELSDILRRYIERRFLIEALELTTRELLTLIKDKVEITSTHRERIKEVLENSDLVKFAKLTPPRVMADTFAGYIVSFAQETAPATGAKK